MAQIDPDLPIIGASVSTEEPKVKNALEELVSTINSLDSTNLKPDAAITGSQLANTTIPASKLASNAVEEAKILNDAVTADKLRDSADTDASRAVTTNHIRNGAVTTEKIADTAVTTAKITDSNVTTAKIANANVTTAKIADANVTTAKIADGAITEAKVAGSLGAFLVPESGITATGSRPAFARRYSQGLVLLQGRLEKNSGTWTAPTKVGTLSAAYRPAFNIKVLATGYNSGGSTAGIVQIDVQANGDVNIGSTSSPYVSGINVIDFDGITFHNV